MLAEEEDHHPKIVLEWGRVEVHWWSHKIKGLHKNDFICAAKRTYFINKLSFIFLNFVLRKSKKL